jgi:NhaP-type Na+/H+ or K+/H+ antiporter
LIDESASRRACAALVLGPAAGFAVGAAGSWVMGQVDQRFHIRPSTSRCTASAWSSAPSSLLAFVLFGAVLSSLVGEVPLLATLSLASLAISSSGRWSSGRCCGWGRACLSRYARQFIGWFGPRGLASLLFALLVVEDGVPGGEQLFAQSPDDIPGSPRPS